jgi:hypothetical protein
MKPVRSRTGKARVRVITPLTTEFQGVYSAGGLTPRQASGKIQTPRIGEI